MTTKFYPTQFTSIRGRFYDRKKDSNNFKNITKEQIEAIKKATEERKKIYGNITPLELYYRTLAYLTSINIHATYKTFDERLVFLILTIDPDLNIAKLYTEAPLITLYEKEHMIIPDKEENEEEYIEYTIKKDVHNKTLSNIKNYMHENFGITDQDFVLFERLFYFRHVLNEELATNIKSNQVDELFSKAITVRSYDKYTDEDYQEAINLAQLYIASQPDYQNPNTVAFNLLKQNKLIGGNATFKQIFLLYILICDPDLKAYQIYLDESTTKRCKKRMKEELGYYSEELIRLEKLYHKRFTPDKIISIWQL